MISEYLGAFLHPERVGTLSYALETLEELGIPEVTSSIHAIILKDDDRGHDYTIALIENFVADNVVDAFTQFGIEIEYQQDTVYEHIQFLRFIATWGTDKGPIISEVTNLQSIYDIDGKDRDILIEFYGMVEGEDNIDEMEWFVSCTRYLIAALDDTIVAAARDIEDERPPIPMALMAESALNPLRAFAAIFPESIGVKHVAVTGQLAMDLVKLCENYLPQLQELIVEKDLGVHYASLGIISTTPRDQLIEALSTAISIVHGQTNKAQLILAEVNRIYRELGVI